MSILAAAATGTKKGPDATVRYEVHRIREPGQMGAVRLPLVEEFLGLDRARLAALGYGLDGPTAFGERFTGLIRVVQVFYCAGVRGRVEVIDEVDERVAFRFLNEVRYHGRKIWRCRSRGLRQKSKASFPNSVPASVLGPRSTCPSDCIAWLL